MSTSKTLVLVSGDGETFEVSESVAMESQTIKHLIEDDCANSNIPLPNVTGKILAKIIEYCKCHVEAAADSDADQASDDKYLKYFDADKASDDKYLKDFDAEFVKVDQLTLFDLLVSANYLDIKSLLDLTCQAVADMIKDMSIEEIRMAFNINNDYTQEEYDQVWEENKWAITEMA